MTTTHKAIKVPDVAKGKADWHLYTDYCKGCGLCIVKCALTGQKKWVYIKLPQLSLLPKNVSPAVLVNLSALITQSE